MSETFTEALPATRTCPRGGTIQWTPAAGCQCSGRLAISINRSTTSYEVREFAADGGRGFQIRKAHGSEGYAVFIADARTRDAGFAHDSCECMGFLHTGHCKHVDAIRAILENAFLWNQPEPVAVFDPAEVVEQVLRNLGGVNPPKPVLMCTRCKSRPRSCGGYECFECETRM